MIKPSDPFSEKIIYLVAKYNALEECMAAIKKAFEKGALSLPDYLQEIRTLSSKQCK